MRLADISICWIHRLIYLQLEPSKITIDLQLFEMFLQTSIAS